MKRPLFLLLLLMLAAANSAWAQTATSRLVPFRKGGKWGYADQSRRLVLPLRYDEAGPFVEEIAWVRQGQRYGYIDGGGNPVTPLQFTRATTFRLGRATVELNGETFELGPTGQRLTEPAPPSWRKSP
ncbi:WG repeat-containing protein [Hymenobacter sp. 5516J-16]|uniref:WG repeat-containing protein n=1 Tax=Hymenobacter sp. 5516J-16 TaxID=2932253 RepID=UPI001FD117ED|nr:WG repeat-containing protein [Hymenobacter sp. 5516J-16]UOQ78893.1 WG repeat-containing protein [Hymenobacter sp. 5516J-16]